MKFAFIALLFTFCTGFGEAFANNMAVFYKINSKSENLPYSSYCNLKFGRVFFNGSKITFVTSNFNHLIHHQAIVSESFNITWNLPTSYTHFLGNPVDSFFDFRTSNLNNPDMKVGYSSIISQFSNSSIKQRWMTDSSSLAFNLLGRKSPDWSTLSFTIDGISSSIKDGNLLLSGTLGQILLTKPITKIKSRGLWREVPSKFVRLSSSTYKIKIEPNSQDYDSIWVDPRLIFSGYSGSLADNWGTSATYDHEGNTILAGVAFSIGFPATPGVYQPRYSGDIGQHSTDVAIQKFSSDGRTLLASGYIGGTGVDVPHSLVCNSVGDIILFGTTSSANFPVTRNSQQTTFRGGTLVDPYDEGYMVFHGSDFFITRFSFDLHYLLASTYLGGTGNEGVNPCGASFVANYGDEFRGTVDVDTANNIYISGLSFSSNFPMRNALHPTYMGGGDGVICKLNTDLVLINSTYFGGEGIDLLNSLTISPTGKIGFCGASGSTQFPTTSGAYQTAHTPIRSATIESLDAFAGVINFNANSQTLDYLSFSATDRYDQAFFCDFDRDDNLFILGQSTGNMPYQNPSPVGFAYGGLFIQRFNSRGTDLDFSFRFGSRTNSANISPTAFQIDLCGSIYFSGWGGNLSGSCSGFSTSTNGLPTSRDAIRSLTDGSDFYICVLTPDASSIKYATFFGSYNSSPDHVDGGTSRFDPRGYIYQAACAGCGGISSFPTTPGVYSSRNRSSNCNQAAFKIDLTPLFTPIVAQILPNPVCANQPLVLTHNARPVPFGYISYGDGTITNVLPSPITHTYPTSGTYNIKIRGQGPGCPNIDSVNLTVRVKEPAIAVPDSVIPFCESNKVSIHLPPTNNFVQWYPSTFLTPDTGILVSSTPSFSISYHVVYTNRTSGCKDTAAFVLTSSSIPAVPEIKIKYDSCHGLTELKLHVQGNADSTRWKYGQLQFVGENVTHVFSHYTHDTLWLFRTTNGCHGSYFTPLTIDLKKINSSTRILKDSLFADCNSLRYSFKSTNQYLDSTQWYLNHLLVSNQFSISGITDSDTGIIKVLSFKSSCIDTLEFRHTPKKPFVPNIVTSNGDDLNSSFKVLNIPSSCTVSMYDRWGTTVLENHPISESYRFAGNNAGVYFYVIEDQGRGVCKGWVELVK